MKGFDLSSISSQAGKIAIVTGANAGLGFETAKALAGKGMKVIMVCRDEERGKSAKRMIDSAYPGSETVVTQADLSRLSQVREFAASFRTGNTRLDLLINNAGIMIPPYEKTEDGFESQMGVNYFSHFLLTGLLFETIRRTPGSRIVTLASNAHRKATINFDDLNWEKGYQPLNAYRQSKLACLVFAFELQRRIEKAGLQTLSLPAHPGLSITELVRHIPGWVMTIGKPVTSLLTHSPAKGAMPVLYAALAEDVAGGEYYGPRGFHEWTGKPGRAKASAHSLDEATGKKLWEVSERLTGSLFVI